MKILKLLYIIPICLLNSKTFSETIPEWTQSYNKYLNQFVHTGTKNAVNINMVDYKGLKNNHGFMELKNRLETIDNPTNKARDVQLAFWINTYNYLTLYKVAKNHGIKKLTDLNGIIHNVWNQNAGLVAGKKYTLDEIENKIIRKKFNEARIHFAIVCAAVSCPDLRNEAYIPKKLENQLSNQLLLFSKNNKKGVSVDLASKTVFVSKIFKWFKGDFKNVLAWLKKHKVLSSYVDKSYKIKYFNYDWSLNEYKN